MNAAHEYPLFVPPGWLANKGHQNWTVEEASEYRIWLLSVLDMRVEQLARRLEVPFGATPSGHLLMLGEKATLLLMDAPFSEVASNGRRLTNSGYALAADMGLLIAKYLLEELPGKLRWETIRKPKSELSYNLPVIKGFSFNYLDPVGGSVAEASAILRGSRKGDVWLRMYEFWITK